MEKKKHRRHGSIFKRADSPNWYVAYSVGGRRYRENSHTENYREAHRLLDSRLGSCAVGDIPSTDTGRTLVSELLELVRADYRMNGLKSLDDLEARVRLHLNPAFYVATGEDGRWINGMKAAAVTSDSLNRYVAERQAAKASNGQINRELSILRRGFTLGMEASPAKIFRCPKFPRLRESDPRRGFVESAELDRLLNSSPLWFRALVRTAATYAWRSHELTSLRVEQVDLLNKTISLDVGSTKNRAGRVVAMTDAVHTLLTAMCAGKKGTDPVFTRENGSAAKDLRSTWRDYCTSAGLGRWYCPACLKSKELKELNATGECSHCGKEWKNKHDWRYRGLLVHDLRRSGVRSMIRAGIPERVCMTISGHKTRAVFDRYNIVSEKDLRLAAERMSMPVTQEPNLVPVSLPVRTKKGAHAVN